MSNLTFITKDEFLNDPARKRYFAERWGFCSQVIDNIKALGLVGPVLELGPGPGGRPLVNGAVTMDHLAGFRPMVLHDAMVAPWPFEDKQFDLFVALQVFEHLKGKQREAFAEVKRISRRAIISLPFKCRSREHNIGEKEYKMWFGPTWKESRLIDNGVCRRIMFYFDFGWSEDK